MFAAVQALLLRPEGHEHHREVWPEAMLRGLPKDTGHLQRDRRARTIVVGARCGGAAFQVGGVIVPADHVKGLFARGLALASHAFQPCHHIVGLHAAELEALDRDVQAVRPELRRHPVDALLRLRVLPRADGLRLARAEVNERREVLDEDLLVSHRDRLANPPQRGALGSRVRTFAPSHGRERGGGQGVPRPGDGIAVSLLCAAPRPRLRVAEKPRGQQEQHRV